MLAQVSIIVVLIVGLVGIAYADEIVDITPLSSIRGCDPCYNPETVHIDAGEKVTWTNSDSSQHTVTSGSLNAPSGLFDSSLFMANPFEFTFNDSEVIDYYCMIHPWMTGQVMVEATEVTPDRIWANQKDRGASSELAALKVEVEDLKLENASLQQEIQLLEEEIESLKDHVVEMSSEFMGAVKSLNEWFRLNMVL